MTASGGASVRRARGRCRALTLACAVVDTKEDGELGQYPALADYAEERQVRDAPASKLPYCCRCARRLLAADVDVRGAQYGTFGTEELLHFTVKVYADGNLVSLVVAAGTRAFARWVARRRVQRAVPACVQTAATLPAWWAPTSRTSPASMAWRPVRLGAVWQRHPPDAGLRRLPDDLGQDRRFAHGQHGDGCDRLLCRGCSL
jgi:hypothetical protein